MTAETKIIKYLNSVSKGKVTITQEHAARIIDLVLQAGSCKVVLFRYSLQKSCYEVMRTMEPAREDMDRILLQSLETAPVHEFYRYDLYNELGEFQGSIYSINNSLF